VISVGKGHQLTIRVVSLRLFAAMRPIMAMSTIAPTAIQSHGIEVVVVSVVVVLSVDVFVPLFGAVFVVELPPVVAGPVVVVVVLDPVVPLDCASDIAGAIARKSARRMRLSLKIGRIRFLPSDQMVVCLLPTKSRSITPSKGSLRAPRIDTT
jgi:hypothetical protein